MDANNKLLIKNTAFLFIRMGFSMVVSLFTSRILLNTIGAVDYGIYNVVAGFIIIVTFINGPLGTASMRFITSALGSRDHDRLTKIFNSSFYLHIFVGIAAVLIAETLGFYFFSKQMNIPSDRFFASSVVFQIATIQLFFKFVNILFSSVLIRSRTYECLCLPWYKYFCTSIHWSLYFALLGVRLPHSLCSSCIFD